jgi:hypothetical protein
MAHPVAAETQVKIGRVWILDFSSDVRCGTFMLDAQALFLNFDQKLQAGHLLHFIFADDHVPALNLDGRCRRTGSPDAFVDNPPTLPAPLRACEPNSASPPVRERLCLLRDRVTSIANCRR